METDLEMQWLEPDQSYFGVLCGVKGSSKTYTILRMLQYSILTNRYNTIHFISPSYKIDNDQEQYAFLKNIGNFKTKVIMYNKYSGLIIDHILKTTDKTKGRTLVVIDDSTSSGPEISSDPLFVHFVTTSRHLAIRLLLIVHTIKRILVPSIRGQIDELLVYRIINKTILESIWEEYLSILPQFIKFANFLQFYYDKILSVKYNGMYIDTRSTRYDANILDWVVNTKDYSKYFTSPSRQKIKDVKVDSDKDKILVSLDKKAQIELLKQKLFSR
jgi:hypothetical protein